MLFVNAKQFDAVATRLRHKSMCCWVQAAVAAAKYTPAAALPPCACTRNSCCIAALVGLLGAAFCEAGQLGGGSCNAQCRRQQAVARLRLAGPDLPNHWHPALAGQDDFGQLHGAAA